MLKLWKMIGFYVDRMEVGFLSIVKVSLRTNLAVAPVDRLIVNASSVCVIARAEDKGLKVIQRT